MRLSYEALNKGESHGKRRFIGLGGYSIHFQRLMEDEDGIQSCGVCSSKVEGHDELHQRPIVQLQVRAGRINWQLVGNLWTLRIGAWATYSIWSFIQRHAIWQRVPSTCCYRWFISSETYPRIDPKHHAKPPYGEMHLSQCRASPFPHFLIPGFVPPNVFARFPGRPLSGSFTILYCSSVVWKSLGNGGKGAPQNP